MTCDVHSKAGSQQNTDIVAISPASPVFSQKTETSPSFEEYVIDGRKQESVPINSRKVHDFSGSTDRSRLEHIGFRCVKLCFAPLCVKNWARSLFPKSFIP
jgi:hypothetical protein